MSETSLIAEVRSDQRKAAAGRIRKEGKIPCVIYGQDEETVSLTVTRRELEKVLNEHHSVIHLKSGSKSMDVVVKEIQYHPVQGNVLHIDFMRLKAGQKVTVEIPIKFIGEAPGVKSGGIFQALRNELKITTIPRFLMDAIEVDISKLEIGDAVHLGDLKIENFEFEDEPEITLCSVVLPKKMLAEEEAAEEEIGEEEKMKEPEVITAKKSEEEE